MELSLYHGLFFLLDETINWNMRNTLTQRFLEVVMDSAEHFNKPRISVQENKTVNESF